MDPEETDDPLSEKEKEQRKFGEEPEIQEEETPPIKRKVPKAAKSPRSYRACALCRAQKRKCDGLIPCGPCVKFNLIQMCEYPEPKKRGRKISRPYDEKLRIEHVHKKRTSGLTKEESTRYDNPEVGKHIFISDFPGTSDQVSPSSHKSIQSFPRQLSPDSTRLSSVPYMPSENVNLHPPVTGNPVVYKRKNFEEGTEILTEDTDHPRKRAALGLPDERIQHPPPREHHSDTYESPLALPSSSVIPPRRTPIYSPSPNPLTYASQRSTPFPKDTHEPGIYPNFSEGSQSTSDAYHNYPHYTNTDNRISPNQHGSYPIQPQPTDIQEGDVGEARNFGWEGYTPTEQYLPFLDEVLNTFGTRQTPKDSQNKPQK